MYSASWVVAAEMARFCGGRGTPGIKGAQVNDAASSAPDSPLRRTPEGRGATRGERHPGASMSGVVRSRPPRLASWTGHDVRCEVARTPSDAQPMLMLVPMATYR